MAKKIIYQESQHMRWLYLIIAAVIGLLIYLHVYEIGDNPVSMTALVVTSMILFLCIVLLYRLDIIITRESISASFGVGVIKRKIPIKEIDFSTLKIENAPLFYGIGLRFTPKGLLYNTRPGKAVWFKTKDRKKTFFVGSQNAEKIIETLKGLN